MSGVFKAVGKVFKSVTKAVGNVVKGAFKVVKKIAPAALLIGGVAMGAAFLSGGFAAGGGGIFSSIGSFFQSGVTSISQGVSSLFSGTAAATGASTAATAASGLSSGFLAANPTFAGVANMAATGAASTGLGTATTGGLLSNGVSALNGIGSFIKDNKELVQLGSGALQGIQEQKTADANRVESARQFDATLAQRQDERNWHGAMMGVNSDGSGGGDGYSMNYTPQQTTVDPYANSDQMDAIYQRSMDKSGLLPYWEQAYYNQQG